MEYYSIVIKKKTFSSSFSSEATDLMIHELVQKNNKQNLIHFLKRFANTVVSHKNQNIFILQMENLYFKTIISKNIKLLAVREVLFCERLLFDLVVGTPNYLFIVK